MVSEAIRSNYKARIELRVVSGKVKTQISIFVKFAIDELMCTILTNSDQA